MDARWSPTEGQVAGALQIAALKRGEHVRPELLAT
jgi:hypothetical protein